MWHNNAIKVTEVFLCLLIVSDAKTDAFGCGFKASLRVVNAADYRLAHCESFILLPGHKSV